MRTCAPRRGFSLLEVVIASVILMMLTGTVIALLGAAMRTRGRAQLASQMSGRMRNIVHRLASEVGDAQATSAVIEPGNPGATLRWCRVVGFTTTPGQQAPILDTEIRLEFMYDAGEIDNGLDDNNDGRADEGLLVRRQNGETHILCRDLREGGVAFTRTANAIEIALTLEALDEKGARVSLTQRSTINMRN